MDSSKKLKLIEIISEYVPKTITRNQLIDWFIQTQEKNIHFFDECTVQELIECAKAADIKIEKMYKHEMKIEIPKLTKQKKKTGRKNTRNITKEDIIDLYITKGYNVIKTSKRLHCNTRTLATLMKQYEIVRPKNYNSEEIKNMYVEKFMTLKQIADETGYSMNKIYRILTEKCKIKLRKNHQKVAC